MQIHPFLKLAVYIKSGMVFGMEVMFLEQPQKR